MLQKVDQIELQVRVREKANHPLVKMQKEMPPKKHLEVPMLDIVNVNIAKNRSKYYVKL